MNATFSTPDLVSKDKGVGFYSADFKFHVGPVNISAVSSNNSRIVIVGAGLATITDPDGLQGSMDVVWLNTATNPTLYLVEYNSTNAGLVPDSATTSATYQNASVALSTNFWIEFSRTGTTATCKVYSDAFTTLLQTLSFTLTQSLSYQFAYVCGKAQGSSGATISGTIANVDLSPTSNSTSIAWVV